MNTINRNEVTFTELEAVQSVQANWGEYFGVGRTEDEAYNALLVQLAVAHADCTPQQRALAAHLGCLAMQISESYPLGSLFECDSERGEWRVLTDSEADDAFKESVELYIDDCILPECPEAIRHYFDSEAFIRDVRLNDGRGPTLASYDGAEEEEQIDGEWYYIYRVN